MAKPVVFGGRQRSVEESRNERVLRRDADSFSGAPVHGLWVEIEFSRPFDGDPTLMDLHLAKEVRVAQGQKDTTVVEEKEKSTSAATPSSKRSQILHPSVGLTSSKRRK